MLEFKIEGKAKVLGVTFAAVIDALYDIIDKLDPVALAQIVGPTDVRFLDADVDHEELDVNVKLQYIDVPADETARLHHVNARLRDEKVEYA